MKQTASNSNSWQRLTHDVFQTPLFSAKHCAQLLCAIKSQGNDANVGEEQPNSMQEFGLVVRDPKLQHYIASIANQQLSTVIKTLFPRFPHYIFSSHHAFLTGYGENANQALALHVDASHLTLNICLESDAQGADLTFTGSRCRMHVNDAPDAERTVIAFTRGSALMHVGNQRHFVTDITAGARHNLIIWYRLDGEDCEHNNLWIKQACKACQT